MLAVGGIGAPRLVPGAMVTVMLAAAAHPALAQNTRHDLIAEEQSEKAEQLAPEQSPRAEVIVKRVLSSPLLSGSGGFYPWFGSVFPGSGFGAGAGYLYRAPRGASAQATAAVAINGSMAAGGVWRLRPFRRLPRVQPSVDARWARIKEVDFHGVGSDTTVDAHHPFDYNFREANGNLQVNATRHLTFAGGYGFHGFTTDGSAPLGRAPALGASIDYGVGRVSAEVDWRTSPSYTTRGGYVRTEWRSYDAWNSALYSFQQVEVEAAHLIPILREQFGLGFRALATTSMTSGGNVVPFVLMPVVGSGNTVRGLANRRYQDRSRAVFNAEYRWRPSRYLDMALFGDVGAVAPKLADLEARTFVPAYGIGARFHGPAFTALRIDVARSREGWRLVFAGGLPF